MFKIIVILFTVMIPTMSISQGLTATDLIGKWELKWMEGGFLPKDDLIFEKTYVELTGYIFAFESDGMLDYHTLGEACLVGVFTMRDGHWRLEGDFLTLELRGLKIADYWYWWIIKYKVDLEANKMRLKVAEIIKNREVPSHQSWEILISEETGKSH